VEGVATVTALLVVVLNTLAGGLGAWRWWRVEPSDAFWRLARAGQVAAVLFAVMAGVLYLAGARPDDSLFWLYAVLPVAVSFFAEQFRILSAQTVLDARGLENAQAVGRLPEAEQRSVVLQIVRREIGIMALAALVAAFLALRAVTEVAGLTDDEPASASTPPGTVVVIGDSLAVGTRALLPAELDGWDVRTTAVEGWPLAVGMDALSKAEVPDRAVLAFSLFTNDTPDQLPALEAAVRRSAGMACSVWATIAHPGHDFGAVNDRLRALGDELERVVVVPWAETVAERPELLKPDRVHGTDDGYRVRAQLYADAARSCVA
jgi:hypothetical protein